METHVRVLGYLYVVMSGLGILAGLILLLVMGGVAGILGSAVPDGDGAVAGSVVGLIGLIVAVIIVAVSLPGLAAGIGLLQHRSWARILAIIVSVLNLLSIPVGTAIGIYGLWVLLSVDAQRIFAPRANAAGTY